MKSVGIPAPSLILIKLQATTLRRNLDTDPGNVTDIAIFPAAELPNAYFDTILDTSLKYCYELFAREAGRILVARGAPRCTISGNISPPAPSINVDESAILFAVEKYYVKESDQTVDILVNRYGDLSQQLTVSLFARLGTAISGIDFLDEPGSNSVVWNIGDTLPKTFVMTIITDAISDANEFLSLDIKDQNQNVVDTATLIILD